MKPHRQGAAGCCLSEQRQEARVPSMAEGREGSQCKGPEAGLGLKVQRTSKEISKRGVEVKIKAEGSI